MYCFLWDTKCITFSKQPSTEPAVFHSDPKHYIYLISISISWISLYQPLTFPKAITTLLFTCQNFVRIFRISNTCCMSQPWRQVVGDHRKNISWTGQIMRLLNLVNLSPSLIFSSSCIDVWSSPCIALSESINSLIHVKNLTCHSVSKFYFIFIWGSTCFGRHTANHQEPNIALAASGFAYVEGCWPCSCWTLSGTWHVWASYKYEIKFWYTVAFCWILYGNVYLSVWWSFMTITYLLHGA